MGTVDEKLEGVEERARSKEKKWERCYIQRHDSRKFSRVKEIAQIEK